MELLVKRLTEIALTLPKVRSVRYESIGQLNNIQAKYPFFNLDVINCKIDEKYKTYTFRAYILDRMAKQDNPTSLWYNAESNLNLFWKKVLKEYDMDEDGYTFTVQYVKHDFSDVLAGAWADFEIKIPNEIHYCEPEIVDLTWSESVGVEPQKDYYYLGDILTLTANSPEGTHFVSWMDGNDENPREYKLEQRREYIYFTYTEDSHGQDEDNQ